MPLFAKWFWAFLRANRRGFWAFVVPTATLVAPLFYISIFQHELLPDVWPFNAPPINIIKEREIAENLQKKAKIVAKRYKEGRLLFLSGKHDKAIEILEGEDLDHHAEALYYLGRIYHRDKRDFMKATDFYHKAAGMGHAAAQYYLGYMYTKNRQGYPNVNEGIALESYHKAAQAGHADAQYELGYMYLNGEGGTKECDGHYTESCLKAYMWFYLAAEQGHPRAERRQENIGRSGTMLEEHIIKAEEMAQRCLANGYKGCD